MSTTTTMSTTTMSTTATTTTASTAPAYNCAADPNCKGCVPGSTTVCNKCKNYWMLHQGRCVWTCDGTGAFPFRITRDAGVGYRCINDFTCDENSDGQCLCPNVETGITCKTCNIRAFNASVTTYSCTACNNPALLLVQGRCSQVLNCRNGFYADKINPGRLTSTPCNCGVTTPDCQECLLNYNTVLLGPNRCIRCKSNKYFLNGVCGPLSMCNAAGLLGVQASGLGSVGRTCSAPFTCASGANVEYGGTCSCPAPRFCVSCNFNANNAATCTQCVGSYLNPATGTCVYPCPSGTVADDTLMRCVPPA
jgi:hypothetical protein